MWEFTFSSLNYEWFQLWFHTEQNQLKIWKGSVSCEGRRELFLSFEAHLVHELEKHLRVTKARVTLNSKVWSFSYNWKGGWKSYLMRRSTYFISDEFFLEFIVPKNLPFFDFPFFAMQQQYWQSTKVDFLICITAVTIFMRLSIVENPYQPHVTRFFVVCPKIQLFQYSKHFLDLNQWAVPITWNFFIVLP